MLKFTVSVFGFILCLIIGILVMINGWGLEPKSWGWIIVGGIIVRSIIGIMEFVAKKEKD